MANTTTTSPASTTPAETPAAAARRRRDQATRIKDAKTVEAAVKANLPAFIAADDDREIKRINEGWLTRYSAMIKAAESSVDGQSVSLGEQKAATAAERANGEALAEQLRAIRDDVSTSYPNDKDLARNFGYGALIRPTHTSALLNLAGTIAAAYATTKLNALAVKAGVTQAKIDALAASRAALSGADVSQRTLFASSIDGTVQKYALLKALAGSTAYARKVASVVFKKEPAKLALFAPSPAPVVDKRATKGANGAAPAKKKAKRTSRGKLRARRAAVNARAKALVVGPTGPKSKSATKAAKAKTSAKKGAKKAVAKKKKK